MMSNANPARPRKITVKGTSGAGKSTFSADLAHRLGLTYVELDAIYHGPNWTEPAPEVFRAHVHAAMDATSEGWVIDGNYDSRLGDTVVGAADTIVWLDLPFWLKMRRLWRRTMHRMRDDIELWNGNRETWRGAWLGQDSLFVYAIRAHIRHRREWPARFGQDPRLVRLRSATEVRQWLDEQTMESGEDVHTR
jgi:adenylate kinase family enzyme